MINLPGFHKPHHQPSALRHVLLIAVLLAVVCFAAAGAAAPPANKTPSPQLPDVLVLVLSGVGSSDQVSINYAVPVAEKEAKADLFTLARVSGWPVRNGKITTSSAGSDAKPSTSSLFFTQPLADAKRGVLPIAPFVTTLKRFTSVELTYIQATALRYRGLEDFENEFVKIELSQTGNTYKYSIRLKDHDFPDPKLPLTQAVARAQRKPPASGRGRLLTAFGLAVIGATVVYFAASYFWGRRRTG